MVAAMPTSTNGSQGNKEKDPAISLYFTVTVNNRSLGSFVSCEGLSMSIDVKEITEGGQNGFIHKLPGRVKYTTVKLKRPLDHDSQKVADWLEEMRPPIPRNTATITAMRSDGSQVCSWTLADVIPVKWDGPSFNAESGSLATETLELEHHGFLKGVGP
jgi:phage tail-like protein